MNPIVLALDMHGLLYHAYFKAQKSNTNVNLLSSWMDMVIDIHRRITPQAMAFCWDSPRNLRKEACPTYKGNRSKTKDDPEMMEKLFTTIKVIKEQFLPLCCQHLSLEADGYEADDIIAHLTQDNPSQRFIIVSSDADLFQLITPRVFQLTPRSNEMWTVDKFKAKYGGLPPEKMAEIKAIAGCSSDNVIGVSGVGEKRAIQYLTGEGLTQRVLDNIEREKEAIERNRKLTTLPYPGLPALTLPGAAFERGDVSDFVDKNSVEELLIEQDCADFVDGYKYESFVNTFIQ